MDSFNVVFAIGGAAVTWSGVIVATSILLAVVVSGIIVKKRGAYKDLALDACIIGIPVGILGARLFSALSGKIAFSDFFNPAKPGLNLPGALLFIGVGIVIYVKLKKMSLGDVFDILTPGAFFGLALGRWSDFFLCEGLGPIVSNDALKFFPLATFTSQYFSDKQTVAYAVFFLDFLVCLALGITALTLRKRRSGEASRTAIILYLFAEFILEWLREGSARNILFGEVRFNQMVLIAMLIVCIGVSLFAAKQEDKGAKQDPEEPEEHAEEPSEAEPEQQKEDRS